VLAEGQLQLKEEKMVVAAQVVVMKLAD